MDLNKTTLDELRGLIHRLCGVALTPDKDYLVKHRLEPVLTRHRCRSFEEFAQKLRNEHSQLLHEEIIEAITTNETSFFRDLHPFEAIRKHILPDLGERVKARKGQTPIRKPPFVRMWCTAVSTGQEPCSLAMHVYDYLILNKPLGFLEGDFEILASDVSSRVLDAARAAAYSERELLRGLTQQQINRFFDRGKEGYRLKDPVRRMIDYRKLNLVHPFTSLGTFDLILCRNVLIYFDDATKKRICNQFAEMLSDHGYLMLGSAENLYGVSDRFESRRIGDSLVYVKAK